MIAFSQNRPRVKFHGRLYLTRTELLAEQQRIRLRLQKLPDGSPKRKPVESALSQIDRELQAIARKTV